MSGTRSGSGRLVVVTAVRAETRAVLRALVCPARISGLGIRLWEGDAGTRRVTVVEAGIGPERVRAALATITVPHALVVSVGFAGALVAGAAPGDLALPGTIVWEEGTIVRRYTVPAAALHAVETVLPTALARTALRGPLLSSPVVVATPAAKRAAAIRVGAVAVEMEAAAVVAAASQHGAAVLALRVILDTVDVSLEGLPPDLDSSWAARARLIGKPAAWPGVLALARHVTTAADTLARAIAVVLPALPVED